MYAKALPVNSNINRRFAKYGKRACQRPSLRRRKAVFRRLEDGLLERHYQPTDYQQVTNAKTRAVQTGSLDGWNAPFGRPLPVARTALTICFYGFCNYWKPRLTSSSV